MTAPDCPFEEEVLLLADGEIPFTRRIVVEAHLGVCASCAGLEDVLSRAEEWLTSSHEPALGAVEAALIRLPSEATRSRARVLLASAAAAAIAIAVLWQFARRVEVAPEPAERGEIALRPTTADDTDLPAAEDVPHLPPPPPRAGPSLRRRLAELDPVDRDYYAVDIETLAAELRRLGPRGTSALGAVLSSPDVGVVRIALDVATHVESEQLIEPLTALLDSPELGPIAARRLGELRAASAIPALVRELDGPAPAAAQEALAAIGTPAAARALAARLWDTPPGPARRALLDDVVRASAREGARLLLEAEATDGFRVASRSVLVEHRDALLPHLRTTAGGADVLRARGAADALGWLDDDAALPLLRTLSRSAPTARAATGALLELGTSDAIAAALDAARRGTGSRSAEAAFDRARIAEPVLLQLLNGDDMSEHAFALRLLARCGGPATCRHLAGASTPRSLQPLAVETLAAIGGEEAVTALLRYFDARAMRRPVIAALGATGSVAALDPLSDLATRPRLAADVAAALSGIESERAVQLLLDLLSNPSAADAAATALGKMRGGVLVPVLLARYSNGSLPGAARRALARIAGRDLGPRTETWLRWWDARS